MSFSSALRSRQQKHSFVRTEADPTNPSNIHPNDPTQIAPPNTSATAAISLETDAIPPSNDSSESRDDGLPSNLLELKAKGTIWSYPTGAYGLLPKFVEIRVSPEAGRGVYTKADASITAAGSRILAVQPHVRALSTANISLYCSTCQSPDGVSNQLLKRCTKCKVIHYCSTKCQTHDWGVHRFECVALQSWIKSADQASERSNQPLSIPGEAVRALGRLLWAMEKAGRGSQWTQEVKHMQSHRGSSSATSDESLMMLAQSLARYMSNSNQPTPGVLSRWGLSSAANLLEFLSQFVVNSFTLTTPSLTPIGVAVSPLAALLNHSCTPNAVVVFPRSSSLRDPLNNPLEVIAISDIAPGEEILTSYVDLSLPHRHRFRELKERYSFECSCSLCIGHNKFAAPDPRQCIRCLASSCGGVLPLPDPDEEDEAILRCAKCGSVFSGDVEEIQDVVRLGEEALTKATSLEITEPSRALKFTSHMIPLLNARLPTTSHPLLALLRLHLTLLISELSDSISRKMSDSSPTENGSSASYRPPQTEVDKVCAAAVHALSGVMVVFPDGHPVRAIALAELGKLLCVDVSPEGVQEGGLQGAAMGTTLPPVVTPMQNRTAFASGAARLQQAREFLLKARLELRKGFGGDGGEVGREVEERIRNIEKEWLAWRKVVAQGGLQV